MVPIRTITWRVAAALLLILQVSAFVPWQPTFFESKLDASWTLALHWAWLHGAAFGRDMVITFGPWGFMMYGYNPATYYLTVAGWMVFAIAFFAAISRLVNHITPRSFMRVLWMGLIICLLGVSFEFIEDVRLMAICSAMLILHFHVNDRHGWLGALLVLAMAWMSLGKFSLALAAAGVMGVISLDQIVRRRVPVLLIFYIAAVTIFWLAAGQSIGDFASWVRYSLVIAGGYSQAMGYSLATEWMDLSLFVLCAMGFLCFALLVHIRAGNMRITRTVLAMAGLLWLVFLFFKAGYIRHDRHELVATFSLLLLAGMFAAANWQRMNGFALKLLGSAALLTSAALVWTSLQLYSQVSLPGALAGTISSFPSHLNSAVRWSFGRSSVAEDYEQYVRNFRGDIDITQIHGTVDYFPYAARTVMASGLKYQPRPVMQSYIAYNSTLAKLNADFLRSPRAPDMLLFEVEGLDQRFRAQEDGICWPELLTRYDLKDASKSVLLLERSSHHRDYVFEPLATVDAPIGDWTSVPESSEPIWVKINLKTTRAGRVLQALYKPPVVRLVVTRRNGAEVVWRLIPELAKDGFLLSPIVMDRMQFALLMDQQWQDHLASLKATRIRIQVDKEPGQDFAYAPTCEISFSRLCFPHADISCVPGISKFSVIAKRHQRTIKKARPVEGRAWSFRP